MSSFGQVAAGLAVAVLAGFTGSSFTVPTRKEKELGALAVQGSWKWANIWVIFALWNVIINIILASILIGLPNLRSIYAAVSSKTQLAVFLSSAFWAFGTLLFGFGVDLSGVALGVGLAMTAQIIFGTILPLIGGQIGGLSILGTVKGALLLVGIVAAIAGFAVMGRAAYLRDQERQIAIPEGEKEEEKHVEVGEETALRGNEKVKGKGPEGEEGHGRIWIGVGVSLMAGLFSALLQFAFVYGQEAIQGAENNGIGKYRSAAVIMTVSTAINNVVQVLILTGLLTWQRGWEAFRKDDSGVFWGNVARTLLMSLLLNAHIELYGLSQAFLGKLGPVIAWPLIMSLVVLVSQLWGILLQEWRQASKPAILTNWTSIAIIITAVIVLGAAAGVS